VLSLRGRVPRPGRSDRLALVDITLPGAELEDHVEAGGLLPVRQLLGPGRLPSLQEPAERRESLVAGQFVAARQVEVTKRGEHVDRPVGLALVVAAQRVAGVVPAEERLEPGAGAAAAVGNEQRPGEWLPALVAFPDVLEREQRPIGFQDDAKMNLLDREPEVGHALARVVREPMVVADQRRQETAGGLRHRRTPLLDGSGTSMPPSRSEARKNRGVMPSSKSMSWSM